MRTRRRAIRRLVELGWLSDCLEFASGAFFSARDSGVHNVVLEAVGAGVHGLAFGYLAADAAVLAQEAVPHCVDGFGGVLTTLADHSKTAREEWQLVFQDVALQRDSACVRYLTVTE